MEEVEIFNVLRRHVSMIIVLCIVAGVAGYAFTFLLPEEYAASALVLVRPQQEIKMGTEKDNKEFMDFPVGGGSTVETAGKTYIEMIKSAAVVGEAVRELGLDKEKSQEQQGGGKLVRFLPGFMKPLGQGLKESLKNLIPLIKYGRVIEEDPFTKAVKSVQDGLSLESNLNTYTFDVKYTAKDPQQAADVANAMAKKLVQFVHEMRLSETRYQDDHLKTELEQSRQQVDTARERLQRYKEAHSVFLYESEYDSKLKVIAELQVELAKAEEALVGGQSTLSNTSLVAKRARLIRSIGEYEAQLAPLPGLERELKQLEQNVKDAVIAYEIVEKGAEQADINLAYATPEVRLVSQAAVPDVPSSPRRGTIAAASLLSGVVVAIGLAFFIEYLNRRVRGINDIEDLIGIKVLATIPRISESRWRLAGLS